VYDVSDLLNDLDVEHHYLCSADNDNNDDDVLVLIDVNVNVERINDDHLHCGTRCKLHVGSQSVQAGQHRPGRLPCADVRANFDFDRSDHAVDVDLLGKHGNRSHSQYVDHVLRICV
jgi:hypothetical protein